MPTTDQQLIAQLRERVKALYGLNRELAAQCDRQGKVVEAARTWTNTADDSADDQLMNAVMRYDALMAQLAKQEQ